MHSTLSGRDALDEPPGLHSKPGQNPMNLSGEFSRLVRSPFEYVEETLL
jgi:hypothetical protein